MDSTLPKRVSVPLVFERQAYCDKHGAFTQKYVSFFSGGESQGTMCPSCKDEDDEGANKAGYSAAQRNIDPQEKANKMRSSFEAKMRNADVPERYRLKGFEDYLPVNDDAKKKKEICEQYADGYLSALKTGRGMILCGSAGSGKTHLAIGIIRRIIERSIEDESNGKRYDSHYCKYVKTAEMLRKVKDTYRNDSKSSEDSVISSFVRPDFLIVDELGVQFGSDTEKNILFDIINGRYESMKPTILISNLGMEGLSEYAGERVIDRMKENGGKLLIFNWESYRGKTSVLNG